jgi:hypothetical protein
MRSFWPAERALGWIVPVLAIVAEGALLAVVYVAIETAIEGRQPLLGTLELSLAAGLAAYAVHRRWLDPDADSVGFLGLLLVLGLAGWLWDDRARELLAAGNVLEALSTHPGGWLTVVAAMRGIGRGREIDDRAVTRFVLIGVPALAIPWGLGQFAPEALRSTFTEQAFVATITFVTAGFVAAGLARLGEIGRETGVDWRRNRSWMGTVFGVLVLVMGVGIPAAILLGLPADAVARGILDPVLNALVYLLVVVTAAGVFTAALIARALESLGIRLPLPDRPEAVLPGTPLEPYTIDELRGAITGVTALWVILIVVGLVMLRVWLRQRRGAHARGAREERSIRLPDEIFRLRLPRRRRSAVVHPQGTPHDAVTAYLAALDELAGADPAHARAEHETPRAHARRVAAGPELGALQAGYSLARYGHRALTDAEHRRALGRWRRLRRRLRSP